MRALLLAVAVLVGCGDDDAPMMMGDPDSGPSGGGLCAQDSPEMADLTGQFAVRVDFDVRMTERGGGLISLCPSPQMAQAALVLKFTNTASGGMVTSAVDVCDVELPVVGGAPGECPMDPADNLEVSLTLGTELAAALPTIALPDLSATVSGSVYDGAGLPIVLGADLAMPATDPLPEWDTTRAGCGMSDGMAMSADCVDMFDLVEDTEMDGRPGATLRAMSGDESMTLRGSAFVVFRAVPELTGMVRSSRCVEGSATSMLEYSIVGSDVILAAPPALSTASVIANIPPFEVLPSSRFKMLRADGEGAHDFDDDGDGTVSCAEIRNHGNAFRM